MKKRILMTFVIATVLFCLFAVGASAVTIYDDFDVNNLENIEYRADDIVVFDDGFSCPSVYVFKDTKTIGRGEWSSPEGLKKVLDFTYINSKVAPNKEYGFDDIDSLDIPQGVTSIGSYACNGLKTIRIISIPDTVVTFNGPTFQNASGLEYCIMEHGESSSLTTLPGSMFRDTGLKSFSMPDCITTLDSGNEFANCKSLTAVYLSKNLTSIAGSNPCFDYCGKMYLVNDSFVATSEGQIPTEPSVYYFPSNLTTFGASGTFRGSNSINDVLVFGTKFTATTSAVAFQNCPANTVVFLGDMTNVDSSGKYGWGTVNFIFANPNDKSASDLNLALLSKQKASFCYGEGNTTHIKELSKKTDATCTQAAMIADYCFCGQLISGTEATDGDALGHSHTIYLGIAYENYMVQGSKQYKCERCDDVNNDEKADALFTWKGYSYSQFADMNNAVSIVQSYYINKEAIAEYEAEKKIAIKFGFIATGNKTENGLKPTIGEDKVVSMDLTNLIHDYFDIKISGISDAYIDTKFIFCAYMIIDDTMYYLDAEETKTEVIGVSYNDVVEIKNADNAQ